MKFKKDVKGAFFYSETEFYTQLMLGRFNANKYVAQKDADKIEDAKQVIIKFMLEGQEKGIFKIE